MNVRYIQRYRSYLICLTMAILLAALTFMATPVCSERTSITVVLDNNYPPYVFLNEQGRLVGKLVDEWRLWQKKTGIKVVLTGMDWADCLRAMKDGKADVIDTAFKTSYRETFLDFLPPHDSIPVAIYTHKDITGITDVADLRGFVVGVKAGDACIDRLNDHGIKDLQMYSSYQAMMNAAIEKNVRIFCMDEPPANFLIHRQKSENDFRYAFRLYTGEFHRAVRKGESDLFNTVQNGFEAITLEEYRQIRDKWMGRPIPTTMSARLVMFMWLGAGTLFVLLVAVFVMRFLIIRRTRELTAIKNHLEATLNALPDLLFEVDISGRFHDFHSVHSELLLLPKEDFIGKTLVECLPPDVAKAGMNGLQEALARGRFVGEYALEVKDSLRWFEFTVVPKKMPIGEQPHFIILSRDITDRKMAEAQRIETQRQLFQSQKLEAVGRLAGGIAHDFNNFLMPVLGYADMGLRIVPSNEKVYTYLQEIKKSAERAADVVQQILVFTKKAEAKTEPIDLNAVILELKNGLLHLFGEHIQIHMQLAPALFSVMADKNQMEQMLINLLLNARDAMPNGGIITIETFNKETQSFDDVDKRVVLRISDTGCGMSKAIQERIFDPFFTTKGQEQGTGLGLSIVYGIVKQYGGTIDVESEVGKGSVFTITLPVMDLNNPTEGLVSSGEQEKGHQTTTNLEGLDIVVVDDDEHIVSLVSMVLQADGHRVRSFSNPVECLRSIKAERPNIDILITDIAMPGINGIELRKELKAIYSHIKVIFMSGYAVDGNDMSVFQESDVALLHKPFGITTLTDAINDLNKP